MTTTPTTTWCELADQLTAAQVRELEYPEASVEAHAAAGFDIGSPRRIAEAFIEENAAQVRFAHIPAPPDAMKAPTRWREWDDAGGCCRGFTSMRRRFSFPAGAPSQTRRWRRGSHQRGCLHDYPLQPSAQHPHHLMLRRGPRPGRALNRHPEQSQHAGDENTAIRCFAVPPGRLTRHHRALLGPQHRFGEFDLAAMVQGALGHAVPEQPASHGNVTVADHVRPDLAPRKVQLGQGAPPIDHHRPHRRTQVGIHPGGEPVHTGLLADHFPISPGGYFGDPGKSSKVRTISSVDPYATAEKFWRLLKGNLNAVPTANGNGSRIDFPDLSVAVYRRITSTNGSRCSAATSAGCSPVVVLDSAANEFRCFCHVVSRDEPVNELFEGHWRSHEPGQHGRDGMSRHSRRDGHGICSELGGRNDSKWCGNTLRRKVFEIAGNDDLRSADECGGDNVFVILVWKSERAVERFPIVDARIVESC